MANQSESEIISRGQDGSASNDGDQLDSAGQAILKLLHKAAGTAEANSRKAFLRRLRIASFASLKRGGGKRFGDHNRVFELSISGL
jgi:hypothetical protein